MVLARSGYGTEPLTQPIATRPGVVAPTTTAAPAPVPATSPTAYAAAIPPQQGVPPLPPQPGVMPPPPMPGMMPPAPMPMPSPELMQTMYAPVPNPADAYTAAMAQRVNTMQPQAPPTGMPAGQPSYLPTAAGGGAMPTAPTTSPAAMPPARIAAAGGAFRDPAARNAWTSQQRQNTTRANAPTTRTNYGQARSMEMRSDDRAGFREEWSRLSAEERRRRLSQGGSPRSYR